MEGVQINHFTLNLRHKIEMMSSSFYTISTYFRLKMELVMSSFDASFEYLTLKLETRNSTTCGHALSKEKLDSKLTEKMSSLFRKNCFMF